MTASKFHSIQIGRALAAVAVLFAHVENVTNDLGWQASSHTFQFGQAGVDFFFVISGFIISMVASRKQTARGFLARRAMRIYPFYWAFTLIWATLLVISSKEEIGLGNLAWSLAGLPMQEYPVLGPGWSLEHEFIFYSLVALLLAVRQQRYLFAMMAILSAVSVALNLMGPNFASEGHDAHLLSLYHLQFLLGVVLFNHRDRVARLPWLPLLIAGAAWFPIAAAVLHSMYGGPIPPQPFGWNGIARVVLFGVPSFMILAGLIGLEHRRPNLFDLTASQWVLAVGNASYGLYLSHIIVFAVLGKILGRIWPEVLPLWLAAAISIAVAIAFALLWYQWVERPYLSRMVDKARPRPPIDGAA